MGVKKFIADVLNSLELGKLKSSGKKKSLKQLLLKLKVARVKVLKELEDEADILQRKKLKEERDLISLHIKKAKEKLTTLKEQ